MYGLALDGQAGVETVIRNLLADLELTLGLIGCKGLSEITADSLRFS
ncbi:alpha-hydroxy-acid oxidizing protein [Spirosoma foliorum]